MREENIPAESAERRLAEQGQAADCDRCAGNGEIVTDWDRYRHPHDGDVGDEAVAACPDCFGVGTVPVTPPSPEPDQWQRLRDLLGLDGWHEGIWHGLPNPAQIVSHVEHVANERARLLKASLSSPEPDAEDALARHRKQGGE